MSHHSISTGTTPENSGSKLNAYVVGYFLTLLLVFVSFILIDKHLLAGTALYIALTVSVLIQLFALVFCFLRSNATPQEGGWNLIAFLFTIFVIFVVVCGSLWIMYNLNYNMGM